MKTKLFTLLLAVAASVGTMFAWDYERVQIGGLYYNLDATSQTAEVTSQNSSYPFWSTTITTAIIPASVTYNSVSYSVTIIGYSAFSGCSGLTSVEIPNSVTIIGEWAFSGCTGLTSVTIPNSVTSIGTQAFHGCGGLTSVTIPNSVTSIGDGAFYSCSGLTSPVYNTHVFAYMPTSYSGAYTIPDGIESIAGYAFSFCSGLTSIEIPNSVTSIGNNAFHGCTGLTSPVYITHVFAYMPTSYSGAYTIPDGIESIAGGAFESCTGLTSVTIPNSVTSIGERAFESCTGLTSVTIPNSVTSIGERAFSFCSGLTSIEIPNSVTSIGIEAFIYCTGLTSVTIPNSVTSIGSSAFIYCTGLTSVTIPNSVTSIEYGTFRACSSLTSIEISKSLTSIGSRAFEGCNIHTINFIGSIEDWCNKTWSPGSVSGSYQLQFNGVLQEDIIIPNSVTSIGAWAFAYCSSLTSVTIEAETPPTLGSDVFYKTNNCPIYVPCGTLEAYKTAWADYANRIRPGVEYTITGKVNDANAGSVDYPTSACGDVVITAVPNNGYHFTQWSDGNTDNPRTIELTQDTTFTAEFAYDRVGTCGKDLALVWSYDPINKVLTIGNAGLFTENMQFGIEAPNEMEELVIGNNVTAIGENAFAGISTLKKVSIGESVKTIGEQAFYNCVNLETIFNYRPTPTNTYSTAFDGVDKFECELYVLKNSVDMYKAAAVWRDFYYTYAIGAEETTVTTNDVTVEPQDNAATVTWPTNDNAATYTIEITKDGVVFCTLIFNANGQLTGIAFAPSRDRQAHAPQALMTAKGMQFTVTGLDSGTHYALTLQAKDSQETVLASYSSEFTTTGHNAPQGLEDVSSSLQGGDRGRLFLHNGQIYILRGEKVYTLQGQEIK